MPEHIKPGQSECLRCERLFVFFYRTNRRVYCGICVEIERREQLAFLAGQRYRDRVLRLREETRAT